MVWTLPLPSRFGAQRLLAPSREARRLVESEGWVPLRPSSALALLDETSMPAVARIFDELEAHGIPRGEHRHHDLRERLADALRPAPEGRGTLTVLVRERPSLEPGGGVRVTSLLALLDPAA